MKLKTCQLYRTQVQQQQQPKSGSYISKYIPEERVAKTPPS
jgi:hypothetical protein